ncbi:hypothetical protein GF380_02465, partial [Candidatus Uhrbacteria bacterium]|nr:hypothetical protein [Candidatus Uhrbacteria bacterium]
VWTAASLTKLMTAHVFTSTPTNWEATGSVLSADEVGGGRLRVPYGTTMSIRDVLNASIVGSANNAAQAMARLYDGKGVNAFVQRMNRYAKALGMDQSNFYDASGMNPENKTCAYDIATILLEASAQSETQRAMVTPYYRFATRSPVIQKTVKNTNDLLFIEPELIVTAGKTGFLYESKYNYAVKLHPKDDPGKELVIVVFGADSRKDSVDASIALARWAWSAYDWTVSVSTYEFPRNLQGGKRGADVKRLQQFLNTYGYTIAARGPGSPGAETDYYGALTKAAVKRYQEDHAKELLTPKGAAVGSGYLDTLTRALIHAQKPKVDAQPIQVSGSLTLPPMGLGSTGVSVRTLQELLSKDTNVYPERLITGYFGPLTKRAVQRFQLKHGVVSSAGDAGYGYVGPQTRARLSALYGS